MNNLKLNNCDKAQLDNDIAKLVNLKLMCDGKEGEYDLDGSISCSTAISDFADSRSIGNEYHDYKMSISSHSLSSQSKYDKEFQTHKTSNCIRFIIANE